LTPRELYALFLNPSNAYRGKPFWSWNGRLDHDELMRQIHVLRRMGMGGFFMHSRTGLATPYLGDAWFDLINACSDEAERLGMEAWLYDEDRWPSGTAGGMVTADPAHRRRYVRMEECCPADVIWNDDVLAVFLCRREGLAVRDVRRLHRSDQPGTSGAAAGMTALVFRLVEMAPASFYNGNTYVDTMSPEATARFIELTHEEYARRCGARLGTVIKGIFTDEPHRGAVMDPFGGEGRLSEVQAPWTARLVDRFRQAFGYDLTDHLPELFLQPEGEAVSQVKWQYVEMLMRLFLDGYAEPYHQWCRDHGLIVTGHVLHEDGLAAQTAMCGSVMRYYEHMDYPGIDLLSEGNRAFWVAKQLQSAGRQLGRRFLLSELYGCTGWQMPFKGHKAVGDWQALFGVNVRCHHLCWYTMEGEAKRDFPASIFHQSSWWRAYKHVEDYFSRIGVMMDQGERQCDLLVIHPVESVWCQVHPGWAKYLGAVSAPVRELEKQFAEMFHWLQSAQLDFDYGDEDMLARMASVTPQGMLQFGQAAYRAVVIGGMTTIRSSTLAVLRRFLDAGGTVVVAGEPPGYVDALPSEDASNLSGERTGAQPTRTAWRRDDVVAACESAVERCLTLRYRNSDAPVEPAAVQVRRDEQGRTYAMILNLDRERPVRDLVLRLRAQGPLEEWDCLVGERRPVAWSQDGSWLETFMDLKPAQSRVLVAGMEDAPSVEQAGASRGAGVSPETHATKTVLRCELDGPWAYRLSEPNVCVLDMCTWRVDGGEWSPRVEVLKADQALRRSLGLAPRGGEMLQPWFTAQRGHTKLANVQVRFTFSVDRLPHGPVDLVIERPDRFAVTVNGAPIPVPARPRRWLDICFARLPIPEGIVRPGENEVIVSCAYDEGLGLEAVYLLGEFGVQTSGSRSVLSDLPALLKPGDLCAQGLPFYGGAIALRMALPDTACEEVRAGSACRIRLPGLSAACALVMPVDTPLPDTCTLELEPENGPSGRLLAWDPYEAEVGDIVNNAGAFDLHVYLTRRNTFGPLHQVPREAPSYGPGNWVTEGPAFSEDYVLWPSGLTGAPEALITERLDASTE
jgi:hypothetical protein